MLRRATPGDADTIAAIYAAARAAQPEVAPDLHTPEEHRLHFARIVAEHEVWVAAAGDEIVGFATLNGGVLGWIYVLPAAQGRGVGSVLLAKAKERRPEGLELWTHQTNVQARRFYERRGFVPVEFTDGSANEERIPDVRYEWTPESAER